MTKYLLLSILFIGLSLIPFIGKAELLLHLPLNDGSGDIATAVVGEDGTLKNKDGANPTWGPGPDGAGSAVELDGTTNYVEVPMDLSPQATDGAITICAWVKVFQTNTDTNGQTRQPLVMKGAGGEWEYALYVLDDLKLGFSVWNCGGSGVSEPSGGQLTADTWHFACGSFEATAGSKAYIDGELVTDDLPSNDNVPCDGSRPVMIGHREDGQFLNAAIANVRIWNEILTDAERAAAMVAVHPAGRLATTWGTIKSTY